MKCLLAILLSLVSAQAASFTNLTLTNSNVLSFESGYYQGTNALLVNGFGTYSMVAISSASGTRYFDLVPAIGTALQSPRYVALQTNTLWVMGYAGGIVTNVSVHAFRINGVPPTSLTWLSETQFGDGDVEERPDYLLPTPAGGLFVFTHKHSTIGNAMRVTIGYHSPSGSWSTNQFLMDGNSTTTSFDKAPACVHPADGSVWWFYDRDAAGAISAVRLLESAGTYSVTMTNQNFLSIATYGLDGPEGEDPTPSAQPDYANNCIKLLYAANRYTVWPGLPFWKTANMNLASVDAVGAITFNRLDSTGAVVERISPQGLLIDGSESVVLYRPGTPTNHVFGPVCYATWNGAAWSTNVLEPGSQYLGEAPYNGGLFYSATATAHVLLPTTNSAIIDNGLGLSLAINDSGGVSAVSVNNEALPMVGSGGFFAKDFSGATPYVAASSTVTPVANGVALAGSVAGFNLDLAATIITNSGNIEISGSITNTVGGTRAIGLRFSLPVYLGGWAWFDDAVLTRSISALTVYSNAVACSFGGGRRSLYPLATLGTNGASLTMAVPIGIPQPFLLSYDHVAKSLNFDAFLGLTAGAGKYVGSGEFSLILYTGTNGGFREALERYYATYPAAFTRRQPWEAPYNYGNNEIFNRTTHRLDVFPLSYTNMSDFGEGLDFITSLHGVSYDATWATNSPVRPSDALLRSWLSVQPAGSQYPGSDAELQLATDSAGAVRYITSVYTPSVPQWFFELMVNQDPEITSGLTTKITGLLAAYYAVAHAAWGSTITSDFAEGGAGSVNLDFYPAHLAVSDLTPTFGSVTFAPAVFSQLWDFYDDYLAPAVAARSFLVMGNAGAPDDLYTSPYIDIGMSEGFRTATEYRFYRMLSYHKAWRNWRTTDNAQPYTQAIFQAELDACLAQGIYPSLGVLSVDGVLEAFRPYYRTYIPAIEELSSAGWEPFTHATATTGAIPERFGTFASDTLCFSVANPTAATLTTTITLDTAALGAAPASWTCIDLLSQGNVTVSGGTFTITLTPGQTRAFWIGDSTHEWHRAALLAQMYIDRLSRSFAPDLSAGDLARIATLTASLAAVNSNASLAASRPTLNSEVDAIVSNMVTAGTGDLRNLATHIKSLLGLSGSFTPASVSAFIIQVRSGL